MLICVKFCSNADRLNCGPFWDRKKKSYRNTLASFLWSLDWWIQPVLNQKQVYCLRLLLKNHKISTYRHSMSYHPRPFPGNAPYTAPDHRSEQIVRRWRVVVRIDRTRNTPNERRDHVRDAPNLSPICRGSILNILRQSVWKANEGRKSILL